MAEEKLENSLPINSDDKCYVQYGPTESLWHDDVIVL
jgi:hypothetical protein